MVSTIRLLLGGFAALVMLGGLVSIFAGDRSMGLMLVTFGVAVVFVMVMERARYQSQAGEKSDQRPGPGGGDSAPPGPPFRATDERFVDPTTGRRMRVYVHPKSGERRYYADE